MFSIWSPCEAEERIMSEVTDLVMPVLQKIQQDMSDMRRGLEAKINDIAERQVEQGEALDDLKRYVTFHMGFTMQHASDISYIKTRLAAIEARS
jgi:hypothetical protein